MRLAHRSELGRQFAYASFWRLLKSASGDEIRNPSAFLATNLRNDNKILDDKEYAERDRAQLAVRGSRDIGGQRWSDGEWQEWREGWRAPSTPSWSSSQWHSPPQVGWPAQPPPVPGSTNIVVQLPQPQWYS